ncbi:MAG: hypothetical protein J6N71_04175 [Muribaculaceae bacterium]|nr:hypothetical protein [Muribaculaceae bacterium]
MNKYSQAASSLGSRATATVRRTHAMRPVSYSYGHWDHRSGDPCHIQN